jgi:hypothetical protein
MNGTETAEMPSGYQNNNTSQNKNNTVITGHNLPGSILINF